MSPGPTECNLILNIQPIPSLLNAFREIGNSPDESEAIIVFYSPWWFRNIKTSHIFHQITRQEEHVT